MSELSTFIGGASGAKPWASGAVIKQYAYVISPADLEIYQRKTATGSGATDPADDLTNYIAASYDRITALPAREPNVSSGSHDPSLEFQGMPSADVGATSAGTRKLVLSLTGRGSLDALAFSLTNQGLTYRIEVLVDGRTVFDMTRLSGASTGAGWPVVGVTTGTGTGLEFMSPINDAVAFRRSLQVYLTPSGGAISAARCFIRALYKAKS